MGPGVLHKARAKAGYPPLAHHVHPSGSILRRRENASHFSIARAYAPPNHAPVYKYNAFGNERKPCDTDPNPFRYCGEYWDANIEEYYLRARTYQPGNGRFTSEDPARSGSNWYSYCGGNPVNLSDPSGLKSKHRYISSDELSEKQKGSQKNEAASVSASFIAVLNNRSPAFAAARSATQ